MLLKRLFDRSSNADYQVLMVCSGNICRSPTMEAVLRAKLERVGLGRRVRVDSAGTLSMPRGTPADPRAIAAADARGYALKGLRARPVVDEDFERFDLILAADEPNLRRLREACPASEQQRLDLLLAFGPSREGQGALDVPDPYYLGPAAFDEALDLIEPACDGVVGSLRGMIR